MAATHKAVAVQTASPALIHLQYIDLDCLLPCISQSRTLSGLPSLVSARNVRLQLWHLGGRRRKYAIAKVLRLSRLTNSDAFHKVRPLHVENRPIRRVIDRLLGGNSLLFASPQQADKPSDPSLADVDQWRDEFLLELAGLESILVRIQLLRQSSERERQRYADERVKITTAADNIRADTAELKGRLEGARRALALRKEYDVLAERIASNPLLAKSRDTQLALLDKLGAEIAELELESLEYKRTWAERREQFGRLVEQGRQMLALIKDEKEEAERKEGMASAMGSPRGTGEGGSTPLPDGGGGERLAPPRLILPGVARSVAASGTQSPRRPAEDDVEMGDVAETQPQSALTTSTLEEGEAEEDDGMDES
jgi:hypothetical protein